MAFDRLCCILGTTGKETATLPQHRADRVAIEAYQRKQKMFHRLMVGVR